MRPPPNVIDNDGIASIVWIDSVSRTHVTSMVFVVEGLRRMSRLNDPVLSLRHLYPGSTPARHAQMVEHTRELFRQLMLVGADSVSDNKPRREVA